ncbi:hypothetical protein KSP40_PGU009107 [Platanthera guangdongensis]|uniref:Uncharacterized protein n=1 Tax=Platanthera guangdongensis TaxID=2320717 RepID=A0ABR2M3D4_9ASPA
MEISTRAWFWSALLVAVFIASANVDDVGAGAEETPQKMEDMAQSKGFDEFEPELEDGAAFGGAFRRPFLFYAHLLDSSHLEVLASDFHSHTFECVLTVLEIDDLVLLLTINSLK